MENNDWENEFWEKEKELDLSLDNENYEDLKRFALFYQTKGLEESLKVVAYDKEATSCYEGCACRLRISKAITSRIEESKKGKV